MVSISEDQKRNAVIKIVESADEQERLALADWAEGLLRIRESPLSKVQKGRQAIAFTANSKVILPALKSLAKDLNFDQIDGAKLDFKRPKAAYAYLKGVWKRRSLPMKAFISVATFVTIITGGSGAGLAALGTAIGLPLAVVMGSFASVATMFYEEIKGETPPITSYREIKAEVKCSKGRISQVFARLPRFRK